MSSITQAGTISAQQARSAAGAGSNELVSSTQFLELLVAQIENQNPLEPLDGTEWATQLAQFANLEQMTQINDGVQTLDMGIGYQIQQQAIQYLGHEVTFEGDTVSLPSEGSVNVAYGLNGLADDLSIQVYDDNGVRVGTIENTPRAAGLNEFAWDGTVSTASGDRKLEAGTYRFELSAKREGDAVHSVTYGSGTVSGVTYDGINPILMVGDERVQPGKIIRVSN